MKFSSNLLILLLLPLSCDGGSLTMTMPSYINMNSELKVTCDFTADVRLTPMELYHGNRITTAVYNIRNNDYVIDTQSQQTLETGPGTTVQKGSLTFVFQSVTCNDFTWYVCKGKDSFTPMESVNNTLQVNAHIDSIQTTTQIIVNKVSTFTCAGTVRKEGFYSVKWYRKTITARDQLTYATVKITSENQCSRRILSTLTYNINEFDVPNIILWCRIESGQRVDKSANFGVQGGNITIRMPSYTTLDSEMNVTCNFTADDQLIKMVLQHGNTQSAAAYIIRENIFKIYSQRRVALEVAPGTTVNVGSLTFVFKSITSRDLTWYMCKGFDGFDPMESRNQTLQGAGTDYKGNTFFIVMVTFLAPTYHLF